ncbi:MAG: hypothetical protein SCH98_18050 [Deferrisomatales bacterium]|nr:hypothetical protein [Deferrisomatales bacterium]
MEYNYSVADSETRTEGGETTRTESRTFGQRYRLGFEKTFYPYLTLRGGGLFERIDSSVEADAGDSDATFTRLNPFAELVLGSPLYSAALGYNRQEEKSESGGVSDKRIRDLYTARLGWRPVDAPSLNLQYSRTDTYDPARRDEDGTRELFQLTSRYRPVSTVDLTYQGSLSQSEDRLSGVETEEMTHSGRVAYDDRYWDNRLSLSTSYAVSHRTTETRAPAGAEVTVEQGALRALSALDDTVDPIELADAPALLAGNAGVPIGLPSAGALEPLRQLGLQFLDGTEVNALRVFVNRDVSLDSPFPPFRWEVYESTNNEDWRLVQGASAATFVRQFETFWFEVRFPRVASPYVKVVVSPLVLPGVAEIRVTRLQGALILPGEEARGETHRTSHLVNLAARARLLEDPSLFYTFTLLHSRSDPDTVTRTLVSNGLSVNRRLRPWLTGAAQVARDDADETAGRRVDYRWGASLNATPLPTLTQTAAYSGRRSQTDEGTSRRQSVSLNNRAALYRGVDVLLNGGVSEAFREDGQRTRSYLVSAGAEVTPHPAMTWSVFYSADWSEQSGGDRPDASTSTRRARASVGWNPLPAVNLFASVDRVDREEGVTTLYNWSGNWSPLRDGTLQLSFSYSESLRPEDEAKDRMIGPSLRWEIRRGTFLDLSYSYLESETATQETVSRMMSGNLQVNF